MFYRTIIFIIFLLAPIDLIAQDYSRTDDRSDEVAVSPKPGWGDFQIIEEPAGYEWWQHALLWVPNRIMDFIDIFRIDVGVGPSFGGVVRLTKWGQVGYRVMAPGSLRVGDFGRTPPIIVESSNEFGIGPAYVRSKDRDVCGGEFGLGADLFLVGAYGGFCIEELLDFGTGLFFIDIMDDDVK